MIIQEKDFRLIPVKESGNSFDLELLHTINKGKANERQEFKDVAYGISIDRAISYIINFRISSKYPGVIDMKTYLNEYKSMVEEIKELCKI